MPGEHGEMEEEQQPSCSTVGAIPRQLLKVLFLRLPQCDSGLTLQEVARHVKEAGAASVK